MDTTNLKTFIAAAELESFSLAAERLYLTQPAVSKRVAVLETELGVPLFDRIGRRVSLTEAGRTLLPRARGILQAIDDSLREIANLSGEVSGQLSMATSHHIGLHRLPPVLRRYTAAYPEVALDLRFMDSEAACQAVLAGQLELAVVTLPAQPLPGLVSEGVWHDALDVVVAGDHPLAGQGGISAQALVDHPAILPAEGTYTRQLLEQAFAERGLALQAGMTTNYLETIKMLVSVGLGWSVLPRSMLGRAADEGLVTLRVDAISLSRELGVVRHPARSLSNAARAMLGTLAAYSRR